MTKFLTRNQILAAQAGVKTEEVEVSEWGGVVLVRELYAHEITELGLQAVAAAGGRVDSASLENLDVARLAPVFPLIASYAIVDEELNPVLSEADVRQLRARSSEALQRVVNTALGLTDLAGAGEEGESGAKE
jgi:hypothetical protein